MANIFGLKANAQLAENVNKITETSKKAFINSSVANTRCRKAEDKSVISHLNGVVLGTSAGVTYTQVSARELKISTPGSAGYSFRLTPTRAYGAITKNYIDIMMSCENWRLLTSVTIRILPNTAEAGNYYVRTFDRTIAPYIFDDIGNGKTKLFRMHIDSFSVTGSPASLSLTTVGEIYFVIATSAACTVIIYDGLVNSNPMNTHLLMFDDGLDSVYNLAFPIMKERGIPGTFYVTTEKIGTAGYCTWEQLQEMQEAGWTIGNHTNNHVDLMASTIDEAIYAVEKGEKDLTEHGLRGGCFLAAPNNALDSTRYPYLSHAARLARVGMAASGLSSIGNLHMKSRYPCVFRALSIINTDTPQHVYDNDYTPSKNKGLAFGFCFHGFSNPATTTYQYNPTDFGTLLDMLIADNVVFVNIEEYANAYLDYEW